MGGGGNPLSSITNTVKGVASNFTGGMIGGNGQNANTLALNEQRQGTGQANAALGQAFTDQKNYLNPYADAGKTALANLTGDPTKLMQNDPGYQFRLGEGERAINASMAARGLGNSGAALRSLTRYGQDYATNEYGNAFNRQAQIAGMGQNAASNLASAAGQYGSNLSNNYMGLGNAAAAAQIGKGNQQAGFIDRLYSNAGAGMSMFSDERLKTNIQEIDPVEFSEMKKTLKPYIFEYLNDEHGTGAWVGVMAQDLEKSKLGRTVVETNEKGQKIVNLKKLNSMILASIAEG